MEKHEYFQEIAKNVHERRAKAEYSVEEMRIYEEGKSDALRGILIEMSESMSYAQLLARAERLCKFLKKERHQGKLAVDKGDASVWEKHLRFTSHELMSFAMLNIHDYRARLKKAREAYAQLSKMLQSLQGMQID
ncbi:MAG: hypothetical protein ACWGNI_00990 [Desulfobacterales bacterium]